MCRALLERNVEVLIATTDADGDGKLPFKLGELTQCNDVPIIFFPRQWSEAYKYSRPFADWLDEHVTEFDVVHIHAVFSHSCLAAAKACRGKRVPYVVRPLGTLDPWSLKQKSFRKSIFWHFGVKQMLNGAAAIHYTAEAEKQAAEVHRGLTRGVVITLGIETDSSPAEAAGSKSNKPGDPPYVLVLSRLHQKKGLEVLIPAFLSVTKQAEFARWKLVLAGEGEATYVDLLKNLVKSNGGNGNVVFAGWLDGAERQKTLREASLLALTSYQENFGLCAVEALACGVPVLLSPHVNLAQQIEQAGAGWVSPVETAALKETLAASLSDENGRAMRGAAGMKLVQRQFSWTQVTSQLINLYRSIV
jgi:glycosyltransferase involved in cell wall biosynthesis